MNFPEYAPLSRDEKQHLEELAGRSLSEQEALEFYRKVVEDKLVQKILGEADKKKSRRAAGHV